MSNGTAAGSATTNRQVDCGFASLAFDKVKPLRQAFAPGVGFMLDLSGGLAAD